MLWRSSRRGSSAQDVVVRSGGLAEVRRSSPRTKADELWSAGGVNGASEASRWCVATCGCRPSWQMGSPLTYDRQVAGHVAAGNALSKLNRAIQSPLTVTETRSSPTIYSWSTRWFWLRFVPMDRATRVLQDCLKDKNLVWPRFQTTRLPSTLPRNCRIQT